MSDAAWAAARAAMLLDPTVINLNTGSFGPLPRVVFERVTELRQQLAAGPMNFLVRTAPPLLWDARTRLADFVGTTPQRLVFTNNVTAAINLIASSLRLAAPGEILLTDHEYGAMHWCWERAAQRQGLTLRTFALPTMADDPQQIVEAASAAMTERTRLFFFSHILSPTGLVLPAQALCTEARRRGILTVVDGAHATALVPLALDAMGCDFYGSNCHKWLLAPTGSGFLYLGAGNEDRLQPLQVSWGYQHNHTQRDKPDEFGSTPRTRFLEFEGTRDPCPWLTVPAAIDFQHQLGLEAIRARIASLAQFVRDEMSARAGLRLATPPDPQMHAAMTAFELPGRPDPVVLRQRLWHELRTEVPIIERPDRLLLRVSTHFYNTQEEVARLAAALPRLLRDESR